ncbi:hypothetical protein CLOP_g25428 [Closterium sp. NIES-67]|nr:hypothetical protein CLOP_g25428 [Closterium sp. NIES-67]
MTCLGFCFCCASHVAPAKGGLLKVLLASLSFVLVFTLLVGPTNGQGTQGSVLQAVPEASNSSWKAGGASGLRVVVGPPSFLLKGPVALKLAVSPSTQQVEWTWVRSSFTTIPSQLQAALIGPGVVVPLANFTASDVNLTVSGGNFTTSPEGNFTFTPKNASILFGRVTGNYFGNNVDLKNVNVDIPSNQITHIAGQISATENALLLMADSDPIVRIRWTCFKLLKLGLAS